MTKLRSASSRLSRVVGRSPGRTAGRPVVPPDPRLALDGPLDPSLELIRSRLARHRRRLWVRRITRRAWLALAGTISIEACVLGIARIVPIEL
ncbi:MAG: hypothetical protein QOF49_1394, partial [Chloroflexota bacterium]|nr:hypothetical protein [Chloroflexota bacterium]